MWPVEQINKDAKQLGVSQRTTRWTVIPAAIGLVVGIGISALCFPLIYLMVAAVTGACLRGLFAYGIAKITEPKVAGFSGNNQPFDREHGRSFNIIGELSRRASNFLQIDHGFNNPDHFSKEPNVLDQMQFAFINYYFAPFGLFYVHFVVKIRQFIYKFSVQM